MGKFILRSKAVFTGLEDFPRPAAIAVVDKKIQAVLPWDFQRDKDYAETVGSLNALIDRCASSLKKVLGYHTINPLEIDAFCIENGKVIVSPLWFDEKNREYTIEPTEQRDLAKNLVDDLKKAIDNLNAYVANNPAFGKGLTSFADNRRCLCWIDEDGEFHEEIENYEFI